MTYTITIRGAGSTPENAQFAAFDLLSDAIGHGTFRDANKIQSDDGKASVVWNGEEKCRWKAVVGERSTRWFTDCDASNITISRRHRPWQFCPHCGRVIEEVA